MHRSPAERGRTDDRRICTLQDALMHVRTRSSSLLLCREPLVHLVEIVHNLSVHWLDRGLAGKC